MTRRSIIPCVVLAFMQLAWCGTAVGKTLTLDIGKHAALIDGGQAVEIAIKVRCPAGNEVLEAFVYAVQDGSQSQFAGIPVACDDKLHPRKVLVSAFPDIGFARGEGQASAFILIIDPISGETRSASPTEQIKLR